MRGRTLDIVVGVISLLGGAGAYGLFATTEPATALSPIWVSDTATGTEGNHHSPAIATFDGRPIVLAPISGRSETDECSLTALSGSDGAVEWRYEFPPTDCTIHAVADPAVADVSGDGRAQVLAATTEERVVTLDLETGAVQHTRELSTYGYTQPVVVDLVGDESPETAVVDAKGVAFAFDGSQTV